MKRFANLLCVIEMALFFFVPLVAWVASVLGANIVNLISEEAIRWFFSNGASILVAKHLSLLILALTAIGTVQESGLGHHLHCVATHSSVVPPHRKAFLGTMVFFFTILLLLFLPVIFRFTALMSVTGSFFPVSPWWSGFPLALFVDVILSSLIYSASSYQINSVESVAKLMCQGFTRHGIWIVDVMMAGVLYHIIKFCLL